MWRTSLRLWGRILLVAGSLTMLTPYSFAQGGGGGGAGGGGGGGGGAGGGGSSMGGGSSGSSSGLGNGGTIGTSSPIGSGNISAFTSSSSVGLSSLSVNTSGGTKSSSGSTAIPAASDPFGTFYVNPTSQVLLGSGGTTNTFGQAQYAQPTAPTVTTTTSGTSVTTYKPTTVIGFTSVGQKTAPAYVTAAFSNKNLPMNRPNIAKLSVDVQDTLARSSTLAKDKDNKIQAEVVSGPNGAVVRLTGTAADLDDQRLAEGLVRLIPGVQDVDNKLQIINPPAQTTQR